MEKDSGVTTSENVLDPECWTLVECPQGKILRESLEALAVGLSFQKQYGLKATALWTGVTPEASHLDYLTSLGITKIIFLDVPGKKLEPEHAILIVLQELYQQIKPQQFFFGATPFSLSLGPKLAAVLDVGYVAKATYLRRIGDTLSITRPLMQDKLSEIIRFASGSSGLISLYPRSFSMPTPAGKTNKKPSLTVYPVEGGNKAAAPWKVVESKIESADSLDVSDADVVVAGGKGIGSEKGFDLLQNFARSLGGAVAASRIAVDLGWAPKERLVGQTGKKVAPEIYIACGISGAHQHRAGMKESRYILAINTDPKAPIFQIATWGIVGDALQVVREMIQLINPQDP